jgi:hypothetical protein
LGAGVLVVMLYVLGTRVVAWWGERRLLADGVPVQAVITTASDELNTISVPNKKMPPDSVCTMEFTLDGRKHEVKGQLIEHVERGQTVITGPDNPVTLRVDPADPTGGGPTAPRRRRCSPAWRSARRPACRSWRCSA